VVAKLPEATTRNPPSAGFLLSVNFHNPTASILKSPHVSLIDIK
jgi:hypothetical protein